MDGIWNAHTKIKKNKVLSDNPNTTSRAAYILLINKLYHLSETAVHRSVWLNFRDKWFMKLLRAGVEMKCVYCEETNLDPFTKDLKRLITVDHILPLSRGGNLFDENNFDLCCYTCNQKKGTRTKEEFLNVRKQRS